MGCRMLLRYVKGSFQLQIALEAQMKSIALGRHAAMQAALKGLSRWAMDWSAQMRQFPLLETQLQWFKSRWHKPQDDFYIGVHINHLLGIAPFTLEPLYIEGSHRFAVDGCNSGLAVRPKTPTSC